MARQDNVEAEDTGSEFPEKEALQSKVGELKEEARQRGKQQAEAGKHKAADQAENLAGTAERVSAELRRELPRVADYTDEIAGSIRQFADHLRGRSIDDLLADAQEFARRNPALFFLGSAAIGVALSRFFKASSQPGERGSFTEDSPNWNPGQQSAEQTGRQSPGGAVNWPEGSGLT